MVGILMRRLVLAVALAASFACAPKEAPVTNRQIDFKAELSRFGEWIVLRPYGRVWHPNESVVGKGSVFAIHLKAVGPSPSARSESGVLNTTTAARTSAGVV